MPVFTYDKVVRGYKLSEELKAADFDVETVYSKYNYDDPPSSEAYCKVVLADDEAKDPTAIVDAHDPYTGTANDLANELADQRMAELRESFKQGAHVVTSKPPSGAHFINNIRRNASGNLEYDFEETPEP